jgi:hypothetical protein
VAVTGAVEGEREAVAPGLAYRYQTSQEIEGQKSASEDQGDGLDACPNRAGLVYLDYVSGEVRPARCRRLACPFCVRVQARVRAAAIWLAKPRRAVRVSLVAEASDPEPWPVARYRMNKIREHYERLVGDLGEWTYSVEANPEGTGFHAHAWQHGTTKIDMQGLDDASARAGAGFCNVQTVRSTSAASVYGLKALRGLGYGLKGAESEPLDFLRLNGGRLTHQSRGFYRSEAGARLGVRGAETAALRALCGEREDGRWGLVTEAAAASWASLERAKPRALVTPPPGTATAG